MWQKTVGKASLGFMHSRNFGRTNEKEKWEIYEKDFGNQSVNADCYSCTVL